MKLLKKFFITDWLIIGYCVCVMIFIAIGQQYNMEATFTMFWQYAGIIGGILLIILLYHLTKNPLMKLVRYWYPLALLEFFYTSTTKMDTVIFTEYLDPVIQGFDQMLFGYQPALVWGTTFNSFIVQELFHFAYFSYYFMIFGIPLYVYIKKNHTEFVRVLFNLMFVFISCYILYIILPVVGGRFIGTEGDTNTVRIIIDNKLITDLETLTETYRHGIFTHIMVYIYRGAPHWGAAFPSSHVAIALTLVLISFRYLKSWSVLLIIDFILLSISTVYCHYHYFADVIAGVIYGFVMFGVSEFVYMLTGVAGKEYIEM